MVIELQGMSVSGIIGNNISLPHKLKYDCTKYRFEFSKNKKGLFKLKQVLDRAFHLSHMIER